jgi:hypothetical protein
MVTMKNGNKRCGVCEVRPSCRDPQKLVFAFRFLKGIVCGLAGASKCTPSPAGIAQYNTERTSAGVSGSAFEIADIPPYTVRTPITARPYQLPPS